MATSSKTSLNVFFHPYSLARRTMLSGRSSHFARVAYHAIYALTNNTVMDKTSKNNQEVLVHDLVELSLDHTKGTPQHKEALLTHISSQRFEANWFYNPFKNFIGFEHITWDSNARQDLRITKELPVLSALIDRFKENIGGVYCTNDAPTGNHFPYLKQANPDWLIDISRTTAGQVIFQRRVPFDEKGGTGMFKHATQGTIGLLTYDENHENVQILKRPISPSELFEHDAGTLEGLKIVMKNDSIHNDFKEILEKGGEQLVTIDRTNPREIFAKRPIFQQYLWDNIQCDPKYTRGVSFVFTEHPTYKPLPDKGREFELRFCSLLKDKLYNLDKPQDRLDVFNAMIIAYRDTVDRDIVKKFDHLHYNGLQLNQHLLHLVADFMKSKL